MKLGFIGTGKISSSVITGICRSNISFKKILVSPRNRSVAQNLTKKFKKVFIGKSNQEIVNSCNWIFFAVTPTVGEKIIKDLKFRSNQTVISFISTMTLPQLKKFLKTATKQDRWWVAVGENVLDETQTMSEIKALSEKYPDWEICMLHESQTQAHANHQSVPQRTPTM